MRTAVLEDATTPRRLNVQFVQRLWPDTDVLHEPLHNVTVHILCCLFCWVGGCLGVFGRQSVLVPPCCAKNSFRSCSSYSYYSYTHTCGLTFMLPVMCSLRASVPVSVVQPFHACNILLRQRLNKCMHSMILSVCVCTGSFHFH